MTKFKIHLYSVIGIWLLDIICDLRFGYWNLIWAQRRFRNEKNN